MPVHDMWLQLPKGNTIPFHSSRSTGFGALDKGIAMAGDLLDTEGQRTLPEGVADFGFR